MNEQKPNEIVSMDKLCKQQRMLMTIIFIFSCTGGLAQDRGDTQHCLWNEGRRAEGSPRLLTGSPGSQEPAGPHRPGWSWGSPWAAPVVGRGGAGLGAEGDWDGGEGLWCWRPDNSLSCSHRTPRARTALRVVLPWAMMDWPLSLALIRHGMWVAPGRGVALGEGACQGLLHCIPPCLPQNP